MKIPMFLNLISHLLQSKEHIGFVSILPSYEVEIQGEIWLKTANNQIAKKKKVFSRHIAWTTEFG